MARGAFLVALRARVAEVAVTTRACDGFAQRVRGTFVAGLAGRVVLDAHGQSLSFTGLNPAVKRIFHWNAVEWLL